MIDFFKVFVKLIPGYGPEGWLPSQRIVPLSFRKSIRGFGAAQFSILTDSQILPQNHPRWGSGQNEHNHIYVRDIAIVDTRGLDEAPEDYDFYLGGRIKWRGSVRGSTYDSFVAGIDERGYIVADEWGQVLFNNPISYTEELPNFNPNYSDRQFGNKDGSNFRNEDYATRTGLGVDWKLPDISGAEVIDYVWTREEIIEKLCQDSGWIPTVHFPWTSEEEKEDYVWFTTTDVPEIENYEGKSVIQALIDLLPEPFDFYFDYNSSSDYPDMYIINKSTVDVPLLCPAAQAENIVIPRQTQNLNFTIKQQDVYDRVVVRGKPILWAGTVGMWGDWIGDQVLEPAWSDEDEEKWLSGDPDGGGTNETIAPIVREVIDDVFRKFKWKNDKPQIGSRSGNYSEYDDISEYGSVNNFFGSFTSIDVNDEGDLSKRIKHPYITLADQTPNPLAIQWEDFLPFTRLDPDADQFQMNYEDDRWAQPFVTSVSVRLEGAAAGQQTFIDRSTLYGGEYVPSTIQISFWQNGIWLNRQNPETDLSRVPELFRTSLGAITKFPPNTQIPIEEVDYLSKNPAEAEGNQWGWSSFWRFLITIAGRSKQRIEAYKWRKDAEGNRVQPSDKTKIIDVPAEVWLAHANTIRNHALNFTSKSDRPNNQIPTGEKSRDNTSGGIVRFNFADYYDVITNPFGVHILRDDTDLLLSYLESYSNLLMEIRGEMKLSLAIDTQNDMDVGKLLGMVQDGGQRHNVNSAIVSVEYDLESEYPTVEYSTLIPTEPLLTRALDEAARGLGAAPEKRTLTTPPSLTTGWYFGGT